MNENIITYYWTDTEINNRVVARRWRKRVYHENIFINQKRREHKG